MEVSPRKFPSDFWVSGGILVASVFTLVNFLAGKWPAWVASFAIVLLILLVWRIQRKHQHK